MMKERIIWGSVGLLLLLSAVGYGLGWPMYPVPGIVGVALAFAALMDRAP